MRSKLCLMTVLLPFLLPSCSGQGNPNQDNKEHDYADVSDITIHWEDIFSRKNPDYFVYVYSEHCYYCGQLKEEIIDFALKGNPPVYFVEYYSGIPVSASAEDSLGATSYEQVSIFGTPALLEIENHVLTRNLAGVSAIRSVLEEFY